jgi:hypothetical protein
LPAADAFGFNPNLMLRLPPDVAGIIVTSRFFSTPVVSPTVNSGSDVPVLSSIEVTFALELDAA